MEIYKITNLKNNKTYVGKTSKPLEKRFKEHINASCRSDVVSKMVICRAIKKYKKENFIIEHLQFCNDEVEANRLEKFWINKLNSKTPNGYNITDGGDGCSGLKRSQESIKKTVESCKKWQRENYWLGKNKDIYYKKCKNCKKFFILRKKKSSKKFCSISCSTTFLNIGRKDSKETIEKRKLKQLGHTFNLGKKYKPRKSEGCRGMKYQHSETFKLKKDLS